MSFAELSPEAGSTQCSMAFLRRSTKLRPFLECKCIHPPSLEQPSSVAYRSVTKVLHDLTKEPLSWNLHAEAVRTPMQQVDRHTTLVRVGHTRSRV